MEAPAKLTGKASARKRGRDAVVENLGGHDTVDTDVEDLQKFWRALFNAQLNGGFVELPEGVNALGDLALDSSFYVRRCYEQLFDVMIDPKYNTHTAGRPRTERPWSSNWVITGNPGIGKTYFAAYLMWRLARQGATVVYEPADCGEIGTNSTERYLLRPNGTVKVCAARTDGFEHELDDPATWFIVDGHCASNTYPARTVIVTEPRRDVYHQFLKGFDCCKRFMPVWTIEEILACRERLYPYLTEERVTNTFALWGGIPREVLQRGSDVDDVERDRDMAEAISMCDIATVHYSTGEITPEDVSHRVLHIHLEEGKFQSPSIGFASREVGSRICNKLLRQNRRRLIDYINGGHPILTEESCEMLYERLVQYLPPCGDTLTARNLETERNEQVTRYSH